MEDKLFQELMEGVREAVDAARGLETGVKAVDLGDPDPRKLRRRLRMSQDRFSATYSIALADIRSWESGKSEPSLAESAYLRTIDIDPAAVAELLRKSYKESLQQARDR